LALVHVKPRTIAGSKLELQVRVNRLFFLWFWPRPRHEGSRNGPPTNSLKRDGMTSNRWPVRGRCPPQRQSVAARGARASVSERHRVGRRGRSGLSDTGELLDRARPRGGAGAGLVVVTLGPDRDPGWGGPGEGLGPGGLAKKAGRHQPAKSATPARAAQRNFLTEREQLCKIQSLLTAGVPV